MAWMVALVVAVLAAMWALLLASVPLHVLLHELGHAAAGAMVGLRVGWIQVGALRYIPRLRCIQWLPSERWDEGLVRFYAPPGMSGLSWRLAAAVAAGPAVTAAVTALVLVPFVAGVDELWPFGLPFVAVPGVILLIGSLSPRLDRRGHPTDGLRLWRWVRGSLLWRAGLDLLVMDSMLARRPARWVREDAGLALADDEDTGMRRFDRFLQIHILLDRGEFERARVLLEEALTEDADELVPGLRLQRAALAVFTNEPIEQAAALFAQARDDLSSDSPALVEACIAVASGDDRTAQHAGAVWCRRVLTSDSIGFSIAINQWIIERLLLDLAPGPGRRALQRLSRWCAAR